MQKSLGKDFIKYASLNILGMIGLSCYILVDTYFISKVLGGMGIAALNFSIPIFSIIHGTGLMIAIGGATRYSILKSQNRQKDANTVFASSIKLGGIISAVLILIGVFGAKYLTTILGADQTTYGMTKTYLTTLLIFSPFFILNNILVVFVRNDGNPKLAMVAMLIASMSNIALDYVFMYPLKMGMFGAVLATCIAPIISIFITLLHFKTKNHTLKLARAKLKFNCIFDISKLGMSAFIIEVSSAIVLITFNLVILKISGNVGVASYGIIANLALIATAIFVGLSQGVQPLIAKYQGQKQQLIVKQLYRYAIISAIFIAIITYVVVILNNSSIIKIFNSENNLDIANIAKKGLNIYFIGYFFAGINIITAMYFSATEQVKMAFWVSITRGLLVIMPLVIALSKFFGMGGVWLSFVVTEFLVNILVLIFLVKTKKQQ